MAITVNVQRLHPQAQLPHYAHQSDAGMDLYAVGEVVVAAGQRARINTGVALAIPAGYVGLVWDKSGLAHDHGITVLAGVIDASYRGEIMVVVFNTSQQPYTVQTGKKIAQLLIQPVATADLIECQELPRTTRQTGGFGSTGV
ncbi:MAG: dUTP diphosphatase [Candidatus Kerfeldbacteria bacterium]|nr:dUTP diphosphatase [Candidatus Kerfeldbacteria bacterium]